MGDRGGRVAHGRHRRQGRTREGEEAGSDTGGRGGRVGYSYPDERHGAPAVIDLSRFAGAGIDSGRAPALATESMVLTPHRWATFVGVQTIRARRQQRRRGDHGGRHADGGGAASVRTRRRCLLADPVDAGSGSDRGPQRIRSRAGGSRPARAPRPRLRRRARPLRLRGHRTRRGVGVDRRGGGLLETTIIIA
jgi:hypothetical protein